MTTTVTLDREAPVLVRRNNAWPALCLFVLTLLAGVTAYYDAFSKMAPYDDEGFLAMTVQRFMDGEVLYDQRGSVYGPVYYLYELAAHRIGGAAITHDSVRFVSMTFWLITAAVCFLLVHRVTRSLFAAAIAQVLTFRALAFLGDEPAHPQEACILLLALVGLQACYGRNRTFLMASLGSLAAAIVLTKINLGACVVLALSLTFLSMLNAGRWQRIGLWLVVAAAIAFPAILMRGRISEPWVLAFCIVETLSIGAVTLVVLSPGVPPQFRWRDGVIAVAAFVASIIVISSFVFARGTTPAAMVRWLIIWPATRFGQGWFLSPPIHWLAIPWAMIAPLAAWQFWVKKKNHMAITSSRQVCSGGGVAVLGSLAPIGSLVSLPRFSGWLPFRPMIRSTIRGVLGRTVLAVVGVLQILYVYPVAGSQLHFATVFVILAAVVCLWDVREPPSDMLPLRYQGARLSRFAGLALLLLGAYYAQSAWRAYRSYEALSPLQLPGSSRIHLKAGRAMGLQHIVVQARSSCTSLLTAPGMFSFNSWTGLRSPNLLTSENWMSFLTDPEQTEITRELSHDPRACVIYNPEVVNFWTRGEDTSSMPLMRFINEEFHVVTTEYGYRLMLPN